MTKEDLIHLKPKGDPYSDAIRAKLRGTASQRRKEAQRLNHVSQMSERKLMQLISEPQESAKLVMRLVEELTSRKDLPDKLKIELLGKVCLAHNSIHGIKSRNLNVNANINTSADLIMERLKNWKAQQQEKPIVYEVVEQVKEEKQEQAEEEDEYVYL